MERENSHQDPVAAFNAIKLQEQYAIKNLEHALKSHIDALQLIELHNEVKQLRKMKMELMDALKTMNVRLDP